MSTIVRAAGGGAGGSSGSSALSTLSVAAYGGTADAVVLTDATMTSGSSSLTSSAASFTSADVGKTIYVANAGGSSQPLKTTIVSRQSATQVTLAAPAAANSLVSGGPNVNAVYGTDNTAAFNAALAAAAAGVPAPSDARSRYAPRKHVSVPAGGYLIASPLTPLAVPGLGVEGAGMQSTHLYFCEPGALFSTDTYTASPSSAYVGAASGFSLTGMTINGAVWAPFGAYEGARVGAGVQDNGCGDLYLGDVTFIGLKYGFCGAYGSDFTRFGPSVYFRQCDVGAYFGPGSQQVTMLGTDFYTNREGLVLEGAPQVTLTGGSFEDNIVSSVVIEAKPSGTTRLGVPVTLSGSAYGGSWVFHSCWFETAANGSRVAPRLIRVTGDAPGGQAVSGLMVRDCYFISGGTQVPGGTNSFLEADSLTFQDAIIDRLAIRGSYINAIQRYVGSATTTNTQILNTLIPAGSGIVDFSGPSGSAVANRREDYTGTLSLTPRIQTVSALTIRQVTSGGGATPLLRVRSDASSALLSGIAQGGAFIGSRVDTTLASAGAVTIDASRANTFSLLLSANATSSSITNPTNGQRLTIEWRQDATGGRSYVWPSNCRFAGGSPPSASTTGTWSDSATFVYDGANSVWREISRAVAVR